MGGRAFDFTNLVAKQKKRFYSNTIIFTILGIGLYEASLGLYGSFVQTGDSFQKKTNQEGRLYQWQMSGKDVIHQKYSSSIGTSNNMLKRTE